MLSVFLKTSIYEGVITRLESPPEYVGKGKKSTSVEMYKYIFVYCMLYCCMYAFLCVLLKCTCVCVCVCKECSSIVKNKSWNTGLISTDRSN